MRDAQAFAKTEMSGRTREGNAELFEERMEVGKGREGRTTQRSIAMASRVPCRPRAVARSLIKAKSDKQKKKEGRREREGGAKKERYPIVN